MKEKKNLKICSACGRETEHHNLIEFDGKLLCRDCLNHKTSICDSCHKRIWNTDIHGDDYTVLCKSCYDEYYTHCERCGCLLSLENANYFNGSNLPYCDDCYDEAEDESSIHDYGYKPEPIFYGKADTYFGVELEIDGAGENSDNADKLTGIANEDTEHIYCKHDGSIYDGFEIVSHPMTLDYHYKHMNWKEVLEKAIFLGYRSHNTNTCGMHIHINRDAFGSTYDEQEIPIARIVYFVEAHWNELVKFSRRSADSIMRWASKYGIMENIKNTYDKTKKGNLGRYVAVNLQNYNTIEIRIFKGTLNRNTFYATLQLVVEICKKAISMNDSEFEKMSWLDSVSQINKEEKPELINYLKLKQLYVYASTDEILYKALLGTNLFKEIKQGDFEEISIQSGEILTICTCGKIFRDTFQYEDYSCYGLYDWIHYGLGYSEDDGYITDLKNVSKFYGYEPDDIDALIEEGFTPAEIEGYLYEF